MVDCKLLEAGKQTAKQRKTEVNMLLLYSNIRTKSYTYYIYFNILIGEGEYEIFTILRHSMLIINLQLFYKF